ncbi:hypothetical protein, partial [Alishewanella longhuensis]|uniref:hypothetical protein n=1 Tax=Alishewanella longhuensis TaxID=1091037 RepID=UPI001E4523E9
FLKLFVTFDSTFYFTSCFTLLFEAFVSTLKRGGHFSDFKLAVKRLFKRFLQLAFLTRLPASLSFSAAPRGMARIIGCFRIGAIAFL